MEPTIINKQVVDDFKSYLQTGGLSQDTIRAYSDTVITICLGKKISDINRRDFFNELRIEIEKRNLTLATYGRYAFAIKKFLNFICSEYGILIFNLLAVRIKHPPRRNVQYLEKDDVAKIREAPLDRPGSLRNRALFEFLIHTGCRVSEAVSLNFSDIDLVNREVLVVGKGLKSRTVFLGGALDWLLRYRSQRIRKEGPLFMNQYGERLDRKDAHLSIKKIGVQANLNRNIYPHILRATFATYAVRSGIDPKTVQELLGHEDLETTLKYYVGVDKKHMKESHATIEQYINS